MPTPSRRPAAAAPQQRGRTAGHRTLHRCDTGAVQPTMFRAVRTLVNQAAQHRDRERVPAGNDGSASLLCGLTALGSADASGCQADCHRAACGFHQRRTRTRLRPGTGRQVGAAMGLPRREAVAAAPEEKGAFVPCREKTIAAVHQPVATHALSESGWLHGESFVRPARGRYRLRAGASGPTGAVRGCGDRAHPSFPVRQPTSLISRVKAGDHARYSAGRSSI